VETKTASIVIKSVTILILNKKRMEGDNKSSITTTWKRECQTDDVIGAKGGEDVQLKKCMIDIKHQL